MSSSFVSKLWNFMKKIMKNIIFQAVSLAILLVGMGVTYAAWTTLTASQGASGQPVNQTLVQGIINNLNDLNTRVNAISGSAPIVAHCLSAIQGNSATQSYIDCPVTLPAGNWRIVVNGVGQQSVLNGNTSLSIDGVVVNASRKAIGDTSGTDYVPIYGTKDVVGNRSVNIRGEWPNSNESTYGDREILVMAFQL